MTDSTADLSSHADSRGYDLGARIRAGREMRGWTQQKLGEEVGVSSQAVSQWEKNKSFPSFDRLKYISAALGVSLDYLWATETTVAALPSRGKNAPKSTRAPLFTDYELKGMFTLDTDDLREDMLFLTAFHKPIGSLLAYEIRDDSMKDMFNIGDHVIIDTKIEPDPGDFILLHMKKTDEILLRKFRITRKGSKPDDIDADLVPINIDFPIEKLTENTDADIFGTVVEHRRYRRPR